MNNKKITIDDVDYYEQKLQYQTASGKRELIVYTENATDVEYVINYNSRIKAQEMAEEKLKELIAEKVYKLLRSN